MSWGVPEPQPMLVARTGQPIIDRRIEQLCAADRARAAQIDAAVTLLNSLIVSRFDEAVTTVESAIAAEQTILLHGLGSIRSTMLSRLDAQDEQLAKIALAQQSNQARLWPDLWLSFRCWLLGITHAAWRSLSKTRAS